MCLRNFAVQGVCRTWVPPVYGDCRSSSRLRCVSAPVHDGVEERRGSGARLPGQHGHRVFMHPQWLGTACRAHGLRESARGTLTNSAEMCATLVSRALLHGQRHFDSGKHFFFAFPRSPRVYFLFLYCINVT